MEQKKRGRGRPKKQEYPEGLIPLDELEALDISDPKIEQMARDFYAGTSETAIGKRQDVRNLLEQRVIGRVGKKGKLITDKLFELINGIWVVSKVQTINGLEEVVAYKQPPSLNAIMYALDRVLGKPVQKDIKVSANFSLSALLKPGPVAGDKNGRYIKQDIRQEDNGAVSG